MLLPDSPFRVSTDDAVATVWLGGDTLAPSRVRQLAAVAESVAARPAVEVLVFRAVHPGGFPSFHLPSLRDLTSDDQAAEYAVGGQHALRRIADLPIPTVAFLEGPCVGPGFELALACDSRLAVAVPDAVLGFGDLPTTWGGRSRLVKRVGRRTAARFVSCYPREAVTLGLVDDAFCQRRARIDLRTFLDRLQHRPVKRGVPTDRIGEAAERMRFRAAMRNGFAGPDLAPHFDPVNPVPARPRRVGVIGCGPDASRWVGEFALRGVPVIWLRVSQSDPFAGALRRRRVTPLEAEQATARVTVVTRPDDALTGDLVVIDDTDECGAALLERVMPPRSVLVLPAADLSAVLPSCDRPGRVLGWEATGGRIIVSGHADATGDAMASALRWLRATGDAVDWRPGETDPVPQVEREEALAAGPSLGRRAFS